MTEKLYGMGKVGTYNIMSDLIYKEIIDGNINNNRDFIITLPGNQLNESDYNYVWKKLRFKNIIFVESDIGKYKQLLNSGIRTYHADILNFNNTIFLSSLGMNDRIIINFDLCETLYKKCICKNENHDIRLFCLVNQLKEIKPYYIFLTHTYNFKHNRRKEFYNIIDKTLSSFGNVIEPFYPPYQSGRFVMRFIAMKPSYYDMKVGSSNETNGNKPFIKYKCSNCHEIGHNSRTCKAVKGEWET